MGINKASIVELDRSNRHAKFLKYGRKDPALFNYIQRLSDQERLKPIPVAVWLRTSDLFVDKDSASAKLEEDLVAHEVSTVEENFKKEARRLGLPDFDCDPKAPVCYTKLTVAQIDMLDKIGYTGVIYNNSTEFLKTSEEKTTTTDDSGWTTWRTTCQADFTYADDVSVGIVAPRRPPEEDLVHLPGLQAIYDEQGDTFSDTTMFTASVYESDTPGGTGENSKEYIANMFGADGGLNYWYQLEDWLDDYLVPIRDYSWVDSYWMNGPDMSFYDRYIDYRTRHTPYPLHVSAAGDYPEAIESEYVAWKYFNGLVVGGTNDKGTGNRSDDTIWEHSCWGNPSSEHSDRELPEIVAPAYNLKIAGYNMVNGTEVSAPMVAGAAASILYYNSGLKDWPEALRAILMATAEQNVDGPVLDLNDSIDDKDGVGEVNELLATILADPGRELFQGNSEDTATWLGYYKSTIYDSDFNAYGKYKYDFYVKNTTDRISTIRVVLTWDSTAVCSDATNETTCSEDTLDCDLDLHVYDAETGEGVALSSSWDNSYEFVQFQGKPYHVYRIEILKESFNRPTYMALAFISLAN